jgi:hypothetical protein
MTDVVLYILIGALLAYFALTFVKKEPEVVTIISEKEKETEPQIQSPLPYWVYYGQPSYWPVYLSPYWFYDVPYYGPITGGSYKPWGPSGHSMYRPAHWAGRGGGHSGVAVGGGGGGGGHGGHGGH